MMQTYSDAWSNADAILISNSIYSTPFSIYTDRKTVLNTKDEVYQWLVNTFEQLEENKYSHSKVIEVTTLENDQSKAIIKMSFTRYLKSGAIMGAKERHAYYIISEVNGKPTISALLGFTPISE
ncbi:MAG: hypothetical protein CMC18_00120 [Flavobacteriaceae bacterium]|nr:hypothetical protein [Flavobacteriaceae bacterium]